MNKWIEFYHIIKIVTQLFMFFSTRNLSSKTDYPLMEMSILAFQDRPSPFN